MKRSQLEHIIRAAGAIVNLRDIVVIGSQAVLGQFPNAPFTCARQARHAEMIGPPHTYQSQAKNTTGSRNSWSSC